MSSAASLRPSPTNTGSGGGLLRRGLLAAAMALALGAPLAAASGAAQAASGAKVDIPYQQFTLPNGLRVIVHTDRKAPIVAVNIWYHVGSKDEPAGRTGFAHLFEHLMFNGSEHHRGEYFVPFKLVGVTDQNGTTNQDRTNYFQNVPTTALDMALWMESDRMGHLLGAIDQKTLDEQRGVVQNEKREGENEPYGQVWDKLGSAMYPKGHPYHHSVIGSMNDLNAATLDDVKNWFRTWYGPNNAVLVLAGDIDLATAKAKALQYFGDIPASPTMAQPKVDVAKRTQNTREVMQDDVPQARIYRVWNVAQTGTADADRLQVLSQILGGSRSSRLDKRLLHADKLVDSVSAGVFTSQLGSGFYVFADVKKGVDAARVEAAIDEELRALIDKGPTAEELSQAKTVLRGGFIRGIERIGGFGGKADVLAECTVYTGNPGCYRDALKTWAATTPANLAQVGRKWLSDGAHTLVVEPGKRTPLAEEPAATPTPFTLPAPNPKYRTVKSDVDRDKGVQVPDRFPQLVFPQLQRATLANGTQVILAERPGVPVVQMSYLFGGGFATDGARRGVSSFAMGMLDEGAGDLDAIGFGNRAEALGVNLGASAALDGSAAQMSALKENLDPSIALFADMIRRPRFDQREIDRVRQSWIAAIAQEQAEPDAVALRIMPTLLYGQGHPYAVPFSGTGDAATIRTLGRDDLLAYHRAWVSPEGATLVVVGDTTLKALVPLLEKHFGDWKGEGTASQPVRAPDVARPTKARVFLIDKPGAVQANIHAGLMMPPTTDPGAIRLDIANTVIGGDFTARINMNLREDKHWSYGARSSLRDALGPRPWLVSAPVQIDKAADAVREIQRELVAYVGGQQPARQDELDRVRAIKIRSLPGAYETAGAVLGTLNGNVRYQRPDDYVFARRAEIESLTPAQVQAAAGAIDPGVLTWVIVGDLKQIEKSIRALKLGEVTILDSEGKPVRK